MSPDREYELAEAYAGARPRLISVAYAVLGSHSEAEDVVSDCWLRLVAADEREVIRDLDAWTTVTVARAALDTLRSARKRREIYTGPWLPEPIVGYGPGVDITGDPADQVTLDDTVRYALLVVLESLSPAERTAWVLHDLFRLDFNVVAEAVGRTPAAVRQLALRARNHVNSQAPRVDVTPLEHDAVVRSFLVAAGGGDLGPLVSALDPKVVLTSDGGGLVTAARQPILGAEKIGRFLRGILTSLPPDERLEPIVLNRELGIGIFNGDLLTTAVSITLDGGRIIRIDVIRSPEKLPVVRLRDLRFPSDRDDREEPSR